MSPEQKFSAQGNGANQQALLELHDDRAKMKEKPTLNEPSQNGPLGSVPVNVVGGAVNAMQNGVQTDVPKAPIRCFYVQFNPAELVINASALEKEQKDNEKDHVKTQGQTQAELFLSVTLYFDDAQPYDAFMTEKLAPGVNGSTAAAVKNTVQTIRGKNVHTVQPQVEALIAALRNPGTRNMTFRWADFSFCGVLERVDAVYTMFSVSGHPVRAKVFLKLRHDTERDNLAPWFRAYSTAFGADQSNLTTASQQVSNLLNFNF